MMSKIGGLIILLLLSAVTSFAQIDTTSKPSESLAFDFGFTRGKNVNLWPILKKYKDADIKETQVLFSIYSKTINYKRHTKHFQFYPFIVRDSSAQNRDLRIGTTYYPSLLHYYKDSTYKSFKFFELAPNISCLGISKSKNGLFVDNNILFFLWYKNDVVKGKKKIIVFPAYWYWADSNTTHHLVFPLVYSEKYHSKIKDYKTGLYTDYTQSKINIGLLFKYENRNNHTLKTRLFPIYWSKTERSITDTTYRKTLFPIYFSYSSDNKSNKVLFPIVWSYNNLTYKSFTLFPIFSYGHSKDTLQKEKHLNIVGLYNYSKEFNTIKNRFFPLYWSKVEFHKTDTSYRKTLFPIYFSYHDQYRNNKVLFPLIWSYKNSHYQSFTVFPLFSVGHSTDSAQTVKHVNILGVYSHYKNTLTKGDVLFPIYWSKTSYRKLVDNKIDTSYSKTVFPLYFSYKDNSKNNKVLFPLVWNLNSKYYQSFTVFPLFSVGHSMDSAQSVKHINILGLYTHIQSPDGVTNLVLPFYWSKNTFTKNDTTFSKTVFPLYWFVKNKHYTKSILFPIYWSYKDSLVNNKVVFPLVWSLKNKQYTSFTLAPLFSVGHSMDSARSVKHLNILGIYTLLKKPTVTKNIVFPLYWNTTTYHKNTASYKKVLFPVYWSNEDTNSSYKVLFPLVWQFRDKYYKSFTIFPLFSVGHSLDSAQKFKHLNILGVFHKSKEDNVFKSTLFPIYWHKAIYDKKDTTISSVIFPLYWSKKDNNVNNKVFFPVVWSLKNNERNRFTIFPLFSVKTDKDTSNYENTKSFLLLYKHTKTPYYVKDRVFPIYWSKTYISKSDTSYSKTIFPIYFSSKAKNKNNKVLFPLVWSMRNKFYNSFTLFPLVSFGKSTDASSVKSKHFMLSPLLGYFKENNTKKLFLFPLFSAKSTDSSFKFNVLYFLYRQKNTPQSIKISALWPLCEYEKSDSVKRFRFAPIYWYKKTDSTLLSSIQPLYYYNKTPKNKTFIFAWFLYRHDNEIGVSKSNSILWKVYNKNKYQNGDYETRFLHLVYANVHKDDKIEKSIFPIYHKVTKANGEKSLSVLFGFYNHYRQYKPDIHDFYEEERLFWILRLRSNYNQLKQAGKAGNLRRGK